MPADAEARDAASGQSASDSPYLVAGLGNPGPKYAGNRHNVGFMVANLLAQKVGGHVGVDAAKNWKRHGKARAEVCEGRLSPGGARVVLAKPLTYMNLSGQALGPLATFYKIPDERIVVVYDELDLPYGVVRLKANGGEGGHNGLRSLTKALGGRGYLRVRFGIGRPPGRMDPAAYVLRDFAAGERAELPLFTEIAADAVCEVVESGLEKAQNKFHALS
ncbi:MAG: aminoacyl-tRNA hydrolase [Stackebrandtia sp.]